MALALLCFATACLAAAGAHPTPSIGWRVGWHIAAFILAVVAGLAGLAGLDVIHFS